MHQAKILQFPSRQNPRGAWILLFGFLLIVVNALDAGKLVLVSGNYPALNYSIDLTEPPVNINKTWRYPFVAKSLQSIDFVGLFVIPDDIETVEIHYNWTTVPEIIKVKPPAVCRVVAGVYLNCRISGPREIRAKLEFPSPAQMWHAGPGTNLTFPWNARILGNLFSF